MESDTAAAETTADKRQRATRNEMNARKDQVVSFIASRPNEAPSTIAEVMEATGLPQIKAGTLIRTLIEEGRVQVIGKDGRKLLLRPGTGMPQAKPEKERSAQVRQLPSVDVNNVLAQLHIGLGGALRVSALHLSEGAAPTIDLKTERGETLTVALVTDAA